MVLRQSVVQAIFNEGLQHLQVQRPTVTLRITFVLPSYTNTESSSQSFPGPSIVRLMASCRRGLLKSTGNSSAAHLCPSGRIRIPHCIKLKTLRTLAYMACQL